MLPMPPMLAMPPLAPICICFGFICLRAVGEDYCVLVDKFWTKNMGKSDPDG